MPARSASVRDGRAGARARAPAPRRCRFELVQRRRDPLGGRRRRPRIRSGVGVRRRCGRRPPRRFASSWATGRPASAPGPARPSAPRSPRATRPRCPHGPACRRPPSPPAPAPDAPGAGDRRGARWRRTGRRRRARSSHRFLWRGAGAAARLRQRVSGRRDGEAQLSDRARRECEVTGKPAWCGRCRADGAVLRPAYFGHEGPHRAAERRRCRDLLEQLRADAVVLVGVVDHEGDLGLGLAGDAVVAGDGDDVIAHRRHQGESIGVVHPREVRHLGVAQRRVRAEEAQIQRARREATVQLDEAGPARRGGSAARGSASPPPRTSVRSRSRGVAGWIARSRRTLEKREAVGMG